MTRKLLAAAVCILFLPVFFSVSESPSNRPANSVAYITIALAGHTNGGGWCECGSAGCNCDPGEVPGGMTLSPSDPTDSDRSPASDDAIPSSGPDAGAGMLLLALVFFVWFRLHTRM